MYRESKYIECFAFGCKAKIKNHKWGMIKSEGWVHLKDGRIFCPNHTPEWYAEWKAKK